MKAVAVFSGAPNIVMLNHASYGLAPNAMLEHCAALRADKAYGRSVGYRYHEGTPSLVEGLLPFARSVTAASFL